MLISFGITILNIKTVLFCFYLCFTTKQFLLSVYENVLTISIKCDELILLRIKSKIKAFWVKYETIGKKYFMKVSFETFCYEQIDRLENQQN